MEQVVNKEKKLAFGKATNITRIKEKLTYIKVWNY